MKTNPPKSIFLILIICCSFQSKSQIKSRFNPLLDESSTTVAELYQKNRYKECLQLINDLIKNDSHTGINYFNRAVINFYQKNTEGSDNSIILDCNLAKINGYETAELYYLMFSQYYNCDPKNDYITCYIGAEQVTYDRQKVLIDSALLFDPRNEKYIWSRIRLFKKYSITEFYAMEGCEKDIPSFEGDCKWILSLTNIKKRKFLSYYYLSEIYKFYHKDTLKSIGYLSQAIEVDSTYSTPFSDRGKLKSAIENYKGAISDFSVVLKKVKDPEIFQERAECYFFIGNNSLALKDINIAIEFYQKERKKFLVLKQDFKADFIKSKIARSFYIRGLINYEINKKREACVDFDRALEYGYQNSIETIKYLCQ